MKIIFCDRCHKQIDYAFNAYKLKVKKGKGSFDMDDGIDGHLCLDCRREFGKWMNDQKIEKTNSR